MDQSAVLAAIVAILSTGTEAAAQSLPRALLYSHGINSTSDEPTNLFKDVPPLTITSPTPAYQPIGPAEVSLPIHLGVMIAVSLLMAILFIAIYIQLIMVIRFGYKLLSYQTVLLFNILLWAALRLVLYSFYYYHCCEAVRLLSGVAGWFLVVFPSALQFFSLAVLVRYFGEVGSHCLEWGVVVPSILFSM